MTRRKIPRELQEIAALLKHQGIDQTVKQQIIDQLTPEERKILGFAQPKPAPRIEPTGELASRPGPAPLKLVTSWPVQVQELELSQPGALETSEFDSVLDDSTQDASIAFNFPSRQLARLGIGAAYYWPLTVISGAVFLTVMICIHVSSVNN